MNSIPSIAAESLIIAFSLASVILAFGVVWRVERELDISFKFFLSAIIFFFISEILGLFVHEHEIYMTPLINISKLFFSSFFLAGIYTMRDLLRRMDGEK